MGPWTHGNRSVTFAGDVDFGLRSTLDNNIAEDYLQLRLEWFYRWLKKSEKLPIDDGSRVRFFLMGGSDGKCTEQGRMQHGGKWKSASDSPPADCSETSFYLEWSGERWRLSVCMPTKAKHAEFSYDPNNPVPTIGCISA
jgi:predicted acyl esterase